MKLIKKGNLSYFVFENLENKGIKHCFSTRQGGVSSGCYESLNLAFRGDERENVLKNYDIICEAIGTKKENIAWTRQVHTDNILKITSENKGMGLLKERPQEGYDGIITNEDGIALTGFSADCVLLFFYCEKQKVIAISHSGWRGTVLEIGRKTVEKMSAEFFCNPDDILVGISPAIAACCFQVDKPVVDEFLNVLPWSVDHITKDEDCDKYHIDLHSINEEILVNAGVPRENIENSRICTKCNSDLFYSHRLCGDERGSLAGIIEL